MSTLIDALKVLLSHVDDYDPSGGSECEAKLLATEVAHRIREIIAEHERSGGWQPIETAPKDGTRVMLWFQLIVDPEWTAKYPCFGSFELDRWQDDDLEAFNHQPTHWQPLPKGPTE